MSERKDQHLDLVSQSQVSGDKKNPFCNYEPLLGVHPLEKDLLQEISFLGHTLGAPLWVSSMTGGTRRARDINKNLARICAEFSLGMATGSCRTLLDSDAFFSDFDLRPILGERVPFYINLGVAQVEELLGRGEVSRIEDLVERLHASGLTIHVNPLQEWFQPEGDRFKRPAIESIREILEKTSLKIIVKEVGQGMGPRSLEALMRLPLTAIEFGAFGGTNFSRLESLRTEGDILQGQKDLTFVGHSAREMVAHTNRILKQKGNEGMIQCKNFIISGGIRSPLVGLELMNLCQGECIFAMASPFLEAASRGYDFLRDLVHKQLEQLAMAKAFLEWKGV